MRRLHQSQRGSGLIWIVFILAAVVAADAVWARSRLRLRTRTAQATTQRLSHSLASGTDTGGWRSLGYSESEPEPQNDNPFDRVLSGKSRRRPF
jgi:hypothetical protein